MANVFSRYINSYLVHHKKQPPLINAALHTYPNTFEFSCHEELFSIFVLCNPTGPITLETIHALPPAIMSRLLDVVSITKLPYTVSRLTLNVDLKRPNLDATVSQFFPNLVRTLKSMHWATTLVLIAPDPTTLSELSAIGSLFPSLKVLAISQSEQVTSYPTSLHISDQVIPFLLERRVVAPIEVLDLERIGRGLSVTIDDLRALDSISGLTVGWKMNGISHRYECRTGDAERTLWGLTQILQDTEDGEGVNW